MLISKFIKPRPENVAEKLFSIIFPVILVNVSVVE